MKKLLFAFVLFFAGISVAQADTLPMPELLETARPAVDCIYFSGLENVPNLILVADTFDGGSIYDSETEEFVGKAEPISSDFCYGETWYKLKPATFAAEGWGEKRESLKQKRKYIYELYFFDRRILPEDFVMTELANLDNDYSRDGILLSIRTSEAIGNFGRYKKILEGKMIKDGAPITKIDKLVNFIASTSTFGNSGEDWKKIQVSLRFSGVGGGHNYNLNKSLPEARDYVLNHWKDGDAELFSAEIDSFRLEKYFPIFYNISYKVAFADGHSENLDESQFVKLTQQYAPSYHEFEYIHNDYYTVYPHSFWIESWQFLKSIFLSPVTWVCFLVTVLVESLIFYVFGSRHLINYLYLLIVNSISFPVGVAVLFLSNLLYYWWMVFVIAELVVVAIEIFLLWLFLRKFYPFKQIFIFAVVANIVTALISFLVGFLVDKFS